MVSVIKRFVQDESGATAIEYGLIAALVSVAAIIALQSLGSSLNSMFTRVSSTLQTRGCAGAVTVPGRGAAQRRRARVLSRYAPASIEP